MSNPNMSFPSPQIEIFKLFGIKLKGYVVNTKESILKMLNDIYIYPECMHYFLINGNKN